MLTQEWYKLCRHSKTIYFTKYIEYIEVCMHVATEHNQVTVYYITCSKLRIKIEGTALHILELKTLKQMRRIFHSRIDISSCFLLWV